MLSEVTGFSNPKCYANSDNDCSSKISKEHFISASLQRQIALNNTVKIAGLRWQKKEKFDVLPITGLASNILCEKHNHSLSPLDSEMDRFTQTIRDFDLSTHPSSTKLASEKREFSGNAIERWMIKCLVGASTSGNLNHSSFKPECLDLLFNRIEFPQGWGLYFTGITGKPIYHSGSFLIETQVNPESKQVLVVNFVLRGIPLALAMGRPDNPSLFGIWRPNRLIFNTKKTQKVLELIWSGESSGQEILLERRGTYDGMPPDWEDWQKNN